MYKKHNILLIDDDSSILNLIRSALNPILEIDYCSEIEEALQLIKKNSYSLILLDLYLGSQKGTEILDRFKLDNPELLERTIMITGKGETLDEIDAHEVGVRDYIKKPFHLKLLKALIEKHLYQVDHSESQILHYAPFTIDLNEHVIYLKNEDQQKEALEFTLKEFLLLKYLLEHKGRVLTRDQIIERVWGYSSETLTRTVDMHVSSIRKKIKPYQGLIQTARGVGYILKD